MQAQSELEIRSHLHGIIQVNRMPLELLPEPDAKFWRVLKAKRPKGRFRFQRAVALELNTMNGSAQVTLYFRLIACKDPLFAHLPERARSDFCWERGIGSSLCESDRIYKSVKRLRYRSDRVVKAFLREEYLLLRDKWLEREAVSLYAVKKAA